MPPARKGVAKRQHFEVESTATVELPIRRVRYRGQEPGGLPMGVVCQ
jgi:hypothetical protein